MPPHRDWTRRGAGRALLYWPLTAFLLVAAFPAYAVVLVIASGILLPTLGLVAGVAGKRWRARRLARARRLVAEVAAPVLPSALGGPHGTDTTTATTTATTTGTEPDPGASGAAWPTGRHARRDREHAVPAPGEPVARDAA